MSNSSSPTGLEPQVLGFWVKCLRHAQKWSQEAVAANSGLDVRTIQRIESGQPASVTTRRALARGLGYDNIDVFDDPNFIQTVHELLSDINGTSKEALEKQYPDHIRVAVTRVAGGTTLGELAGTATGMLLHWHDDVSKPAKDAAAELFDYLRDLQDIYDDLSFADRLRCQEALGGILTTLEGHAAVAYSATRNTKIVGENWINKTPMSFTAVYVAVMPADHEVKEILVPRRLS